MDDQLLTWAAALTYYAMLAFFPAMIAVVSLIAVLGNPAGTNETITEILSKVVPDSAVQALQDPIASILANQGAAGVLLVVGIAASILSASGYVSALATACNVIYETREGRPFWKLKPAQLLTTLVMVLLFTLVVVALVITGPLVVAIGDAIGVGPAGQMVFTAAKWPLLLVVVTGMVAGLYYVSPNVRQRGFRWVLPGSLLAVVVWLAASAGFATYVANFGSYDRTYGALGGVITFLVWLWISNSAVLLGAELNAELERSRELERGVAAERELRLPPRDEPSPSDTA
jgi:membrane protein